MNTTIRAALKDAIEAAYHWDIHHAIHQDKGGPNENEKANQDTRYERETRAINTMLTELLKDPRHQGYGAYPDPWAAVRRGVMRLHKQALHEPPTTVGHKAAVFWGADRK